MSVKSFKTAIDETDEMDRSILLGNGFSIGQSDGRFSYDNLLEKSGLEEDGAIRKVFETFQTVDFEKVMNALEDAAKVETAYGNKKRAAALLDDASSVRQALIQAIQAVHPAIRFDISEKQYEACATFLEYFQEIFTLNYDLLLYWVLLEGRLKTTDGFGLGDVSDGLRTFSEEAYCSTYYLHGALHLFLGKQREAQKQILVGDTIVGDISNRIRRSRRPPLFVAEGSSSQKMAKINSVPYLKHCLDKLHGAEGCLFVFGNSASRQDHHIYSAIFQSKLKSIYFCVHKPKVNLQRMQERLAPFQVRNSKLKVKYVDAATVKVWG